MERERTRKKEETEGRSEDASPCGARNVYSSRIPKVAREVEACIDKRVEQALYRKARFPAGE